MSERELNFISRYSREKDMLVLDIGSGSGRILEHHLQSEYAREIYAIDVSEEMVKQCQRKFAHHRKLVAIVACDIAKEAIPFNMAFDLITCIRVLKYNKNWPEIVEKCMEKLNPGGVFLFTMPNKYSTNIFSRYQIPYYLTNKSELVNLAEKKGGTVLTVQSFTKIPDFFYEVTNHFLYAKFLELIEIFLETLLGKTLFGRILFVAVRKSASKSTI